MDYTVLYNNRDCHYPEFSRAISTRLKRLIVLPTVIASEDAQACADRTLQSCVQHALIVQRDFAGGNVGAGRTGRNPQILVQK